MGTRPSPCGSAYKRSCIVIIVHSPLSHRNRSAFLRPLRSTASIALRCPRARWIPLHEAARVAGSTIAPLLPVSRNSAHIPAQPPLSAPASRQVDALLPAPPGSTPNLPAEPPL